MGGLVSEKVISLIADLLPALQRIFRGEGHGELEIPDNLQGLNKIVNDDVKLSAKLFKSASTIKGLV